MQRGRMIITLSSGWLLKELSCSSSNWQLRPSLAFASTSHLHQPPQFASRMRVSELLHHRVFYGLCFLRSFGFHRGICESIHSFSIASMIQNVCIMQMMLSYVIKDVADSRKIPTRHWAWRHATSVYFYQTDKYLYIMIFSIFKCICIYIYILLIFIFIYIVKFMCIYIVLLLLKKILHHVKHKKNLFDQ